MVIQVSNHSRVLLVNKDFINRHDQYTQSVQIRSEHHCLTKIIPQTIKVDFDTSLIFQELCKKILILHELIKVKFDIKKCSQV